MPAQLRHFLVRLRACRRGGSGGGPGGVGGGQPSFQRPYFLHQRIFLFSHASLRGVQLRLESFDACFEERGRSIAFLFKLAGGAGLPGSKGADLFLHLSIEMALPTGLSLPLEEGRQPANNAQPSAVGQTQRKAFEKAVAGKHRGGIGRQGHRGCTWWWPAAHNLVHLTANIRQAGAGRRLLYQVDQLEVIEGTHAGVDASFEKSECIVALHLRVRPPELAHIRLPRVVSDNACHQKVACHQVVCVVHSRSVRDS